MRRMDRYKEEDTISEKRSNKNKDLYQNINAKYTNITDVTNANVYEINNTSESNTTREKYRQLKNYSMQEPISKEKKELNDFNHLYPKTERKVYDINSVLEEARKNKQEDDALDEKRKLKHTSYNVLAGVNIEELLKYREEKKKREITEEEKEIRDLVDTIASKTLARELDKETTVDLLRDLMATNAFDKVEASSEIGTIDEETKDDTTTELSSEELEDKLKEVDEEAIKSKRVDKVDTDFYTRSMDLSEEDFETDQELAKKTLSTPFKVLLVLLILIVIGLTAYYFYKRM